ncbi:MAG TPA: 7-carboxy-7-deazaguanine synthase QueE [Abditibacteriaceae bacterium]
MKPILISEIFGPTIQGEGALVGKPTVFVRTGGCDYRCSWCDTLYAVLPEHRGEWLKMSAEEILQRVHELSGGPILVTLSGGNPALQPLEPLLDLGRERGFSFAMETQGSTAKEWFARLDYLVLSPKPPSSNMETDWRALQNCVEAAGVSTQVVLKVVVFDDADYAYARKVHQRFPAVPVVLQVGTQATSTRDASAAASGDADITQRTEWLLRCASRDKWFDVTILPQLHVLLWGNKRGV